MKTTILEKSSELFLNQGFKTTTMDDICQEMGISKKTIYQHFSNKTELINECNKSYLSWLKQTMEQIYKENTHPVLFIFSLDKKTPFMSKADPNLASHSTTQLRKYYPKIYKKFTEEFFLIFHKYYTENLRNGIEQGFFLEKLNIDFVSRIFFAMMTEIHNESAYISRIYNFSERKLYFKQYHIRAISTPKGVAVLEDYIKHNSII